MSTLACNNLIPALLPGITQSGRATAFELGGYLINRNRPLRGVATAGCDGCKVFDMKSNIFRVIDCIAISNGILPRDAWVVYDLHDVFLVA